MVVTSGGDGYPQPSRNLSPQQQLQMQMEADRLRRLQEQEAAAEATAQAAAQAAQVQAAQAATAAEVESMRRDTVGPSPTGVRIFNPRTGKAEPGVYNVEERRWVPVTQVTYEQVKRGAVGMNTATVMRPVQQQPTMPPAQQPLSKGQIKHMGETEPEEQPWDKPFKAQGISPTGVSRTPNPEVKTRTGETMMSETVTYGEAWVLPWSTPVVYEPGGNTYERAVTQHGSPLMSSGGYDPSRGVFVVTTATGDQSGKTLGGLYKGKIGGEQTMEGGGRTLEELWSRRVQEPAAAPVQAQAKGPDLLQTGQAFARALLLSFGYQATHPAGQPAITDVNVGSSTVKTATPFVRMYERGGEVTSVIEEKVVQPVEKALDTNTPEANRAWATATLLFGKIPNPTLIKTQKEIAKANIEFVAGLPGGSVQMVGAMGIGATAVPQNPAAVAGAGAAIGAAVVEGQIRGFQENPTKTLVFDIYNVAMMGEAGYNIARGGYRVTKGAMKAGRVPEFIDYLKTSEEASFTYGGRERVDVTRVAEVLENAKAKTTVTGTPDMVPTGVEKGPSVTEISSVLERARERTVVSGTPDYVPTGAPYEGPKTELTHVTEALETAQVKTRITGTPDMIRESYPVEKGSDIVHVVDVLEADKLKTRITGTPEYVPTGPAYGEEPVSITHVTDVLETAKGRTKVLGTPEVPDYVPTGPRYGEGKVSVTRVTEPLEAARERTVVSGTPDFISGAEAGEELVSNVRARPMRYMDYVMEEAMKTPSPTAKATVEELMRKTTMTKESEYIKITKIPPEEAGPGAGGQKIQVLVDGTTVTESIAMEESLVVEAKPVVNKLSKLPDVDPTKGGFRAENPDYFGEEDLFGKQTAKASKKDIYGDLGYEHGPEYYKRVLEGLKASEAERTAQVLNTDVVLSNEGIPGYLAAKSLLWKEMSTPGQVSPQQSLPDQLSGLGEAGALDTGLGLLGLSIQDVFQSSQTRLTQRQVQRQLLRTGMDVEMGRLTETGREESRYEGFEIAEPAESPEKKLPKPLLDIGDPFQEPSRRKRRTTYARIWINPSPISGAGHAPVTIRIKGGSI